MSGGDYRNRPSLHIPGKEFLIVIVVIFSSISFTLGYFVGKSTGNAGSGPPVPIAEGTAPQKASGSHDVQTRAKAPGGADYPAPAVETGREGKVGTSPSHAEKPASASPPAEYHASEHAEKAARAVKRFYSKGKLQKGTISYTVQIGALSNEKDAENLRARYGKKGYRAYIVAAKNKRGENIYKVRIGEFRNRRNAELLSLKLRKTEELNTFVTFKGE
jgi:cell division septation protein DedD